MHMNRFHFLTSFVVFAAVLLTGCNTSPDKHAIRAFSEGDYEKADKLLTSARLQIATSRYMLDKAYILRANGHIALSTGNLERALELTPGGAELQNTLKQEIYINLILNAYLLNDLQGIGKLLNQARGTFSEDDSWWLLFQGLNAYLNGRYSEANALWKGLTEPKYLSPWMEIAFSKQLPPAWITQLKMRAAIFSGSYQKIRKELELQKEGDVQNKEQVLFMIALTYIQEGLEKEPGKALPNFKSAFEYLNKIPDVQSKFPQDIYYVNTLIYKEIQILLSSQKYEDLPFYVDALQKWSSEKVLKELSQIVTKQFYVLIEKGKWEELAKMAPSINELLTDESIRTELSSRFEELTLSALERGELAPAQQLMGLVRMFSVNPKAADQRIASSLLVQVFNQFKSSNVSKEKIQKLIDFWSGIEKNPAIRFQLAQKLLDMARVAWSTTGNDKKALMEMYFAFNIVPANRQNELKRMMESMIGVVYSLSIAQSDFDKLKYVKEAQKAFSLDPSILKEPKEMANLQADAELLYKQANYNKAFLVAEWIVTVQPDSQNALKLAGLSAYQVADYASALPYLRKLSNDREIAIPLAVAEVAAGDASSGNKLLLQESKTQTLESSLYERLAIAELQKGNAGEALEWISKAPKETDFLNSLKLLSAFLKGDYASVIEQYHALPVPYKKLQALNGAAAIAAMRLHRDDEAEELVRDLYESSQASVGSPSPPFMLLLQNPELAPPKEFAGALYYSNISHSSEKALQQLNLLSQPFLDSVIQKAEILLALHRYSEALQFLTDNQSLLDSSLLKSILAPKYWAVYAQAQGYLGAWIESVDAWKKYFALSKESPNESYIRNYSKSLKELRLYDAAEKELHRIPEKTLKAEDHLALIQCIIHRGDFKTAEKETLLWLEKYPKRFDLRFKLACMMLIIRNDALYQAALDKMPPADQFTDEISKSYFDLLVFRGDYVVAQELLKTHAMSWEKDPEVQKIVFRLYAGLSEKKLAQEAARNVAKFAPDNIEDAIFAVQHGDDLPYVSAWVARLHKFNDKESISPSKAVLFALALQEEALEGLLTGKFSSSEQAPELRKVIAIFEKLQNDNPNIPELKFYYGQAFFLLGQKEKGLKSFEEAIALDPSYADAYIYSGEVYAGMDKWELAQKSFKMAVQYAPDDGRAWDKLGNAELKLENAKDALEAFTEAAIHKPNQPAIYLNLGKLELLANHPDKAVAAFERAVALKPNDISSLQGLLKALYDPHLVFEKGTASKIARQKEVYEKLYKLDPQSAVNFKKALISK